MCVYTFGHIFMYFSIQHFCANLIMTYFCKACRQETWK